MVNTIFQHSHYITAKRELSNFIKTSKSGRIIILIGISGVGKTTLRHDVMRAIYGDILLWGIGKIPAIELMMMLPEMGFYNSKALSISSRDELFAPNMEWLIEPGKKVEHHLQEILDSVRKSMELWSLMPQEKKGEKEAWRDFIRFSKLREVDLISLEHANAMCVNRQNTLPAQHVIHLMSLSESIRSRLLFTTVENGWELWRKRKEISERVDFVWFQNYDIANNADRLPYLAALKSVFKGHQCNPVNLPQIMAREIAVVTAGGYGGMINLRNRAINSATKAGRHLINKEDIENSYPNVETIGDLEESVKRFNEARASCPPPIVEERGLAAWPRNTKKPAGGEKNA